MATTDETADPASRRVERFPTTEPVQLDVSLGAGSVTVHLVATPQDADTNGSADGGEVLVELEHDPTANGSWADDMAAMLNLFGSRFAEQFGTPRRGDPAAALAQVRVEQSGRTIVVHAPDAPALRGITLNATIHAPAGSDLSGTSSAGDIT